MTDELNARSKIFHLLEASRSSGLDFQGLVTSPVPCWQNEIDAHFIYQHLNHIYIKGESCQIPVITPVKVHNL